MPARLLWVALVTLAASVATLAGPAAGAAQPHPTVTPPPTTIPPHQFLPAGPAAELTIAYDRQGRFLRVLTPTEVAALPTPFACSGYENASATITTPAGNTYKTIGNACLFDSTGTFDIGAVARFKCIRNGVVWGAGYGGCRWVWNQVMQRSNDGGTTWQTMTSNDNCYTCEGEFVADTGRWYGNQIYALWCGYALRAATRGTATQPYLVRIHFPDGSERLLGMRVVIGKAWRTPC
jgi:hypothetical protein